MAKKVEKVEKVEKESTRGRYGDGNGLMLLIKPSGAKSPEADGLATDVDPAIMPQVIDVVRKNGNLKHRRHLG